MKIELNGKALLAVGLLSAGLAFGEYVSVISSDSVSYTSAQPPGLSIDDVMPVGSIVMRMDSVNPTTLYGGTWTLITGDAALSFGDGTDLSGLVYGDNNPLVPLPEHSHKMRGTNGTSSSNWNDFLGGSTANYGAGQGAEINGYTTGVEGEKNARLDVRGARIDINVWKRTL